MPATPDRLHYAEHEFDVCVVGGGMAGLCAAIASARNGARTALVHDRPVFGGNASSEVRMWICGAHGAHNKETGLLEEIQLENQYRNPTGNYSLWDGVLYGKAFFQPGLTSFLNAGVTDAERDGSGRIVAVRAWQGTSQTWHTVRARVFIDCSGDSILAAVAGADFRAGREARHEFDEDIQPEAADAKTMGNTLLIQVRRTDQPQPFIPPRWAYKFNGPGDLAHRVHGGVSADNFWWLEVGGLQDTIRDAEPIRDELMRLGYGVWDYLKNHAPERARTENWALEWLGALPGKRENRRLLGDHVLTQNDIRAGGDFPDVVAYGGWSMDDHHPAGLLYPGEPTVFHPAPSPYGIPYRCLYSRNVPNLLFAGRNISVTHAALSSTRVMGTCALLGQAAGTAAALCARHRCDPRALSSGARLAELQTTLMDDDCWLPGRTRAAGELARCGRLSGPGRDLPALLDGTDRDRPGEPTHAWTGPVGGEGTLFTWKTPVPVGGARLVFDSDLQLHKRMPCTYPHRAGGKSALPGSLVRTFRLDARDAAGRWETVHREMDNHRRLLLVPLRLEATALRLVPEETWGGTAEARVFAFEPLETCAAKIPDYPDGPSFAQVRARVAAADLTPPTSRDANDTRRRSIPA